MKLRKDQPKQKKTARSERGPDSAGWHQMSRKQRREMARKIHAEDLSLEVVHPHAAGIDIVYEFRYAALPSTRDEQPVRRFGCTTAELKAMAAWLKQSGIYRSAAIHGGVLDRGLRHSGHGAWKSGECTGNEESAGTQDRRAGSKIASTQIVFFVSDLPGVRLGSRALECPDHSCSTGSLRLFRYCQTSLLVANALMQNHPD
jgi:hypothetical protein